MLLQEMPSMRPHAASTALRWRRHFPTYQHRVPASALLITAGMEVKEGSLSGKISEGSYLTLSIQETREGKTGRS